MLNQSANSTIEIREAWSARWNMSSGCETREERGMKRAVLCDNHFCALSRDQEVSFTFS
jgi:hypothetical protein